MKLAVRMKYVLLDFDLSINIEWMKKIKRFKSNSKEKRCKCLNIENHCHMPKRLSSNEVLENF